MNEQEENQPEIISKEKRRNFEECNESLFINIEESRQILRKIQKLLSTSIDDNNEEGDDDDNDNTIQKQQLSEEIYNLQQIICYKVRIDLEELECYKKIDIIDNDNNGFCLENIMIENSQQKTIDLLIQVISFIENNSEDSIIPTNIIIDDGTMDCQACIAQIFELSLDITTTTTVAAASDDNKENYKERITIMYSNYQLKLLRSRCKPYIAELVHYRKQKHQQNENNESDDNNNMHVHTITQILSEGSTLLHPLMQWKDVLDMKNNKYLLYMITKTITKLNNEINIFITKIFSWFDIDCMISSYWLDIAKKYQQTKKQDDDNNDSTAIVVITDDLEQLLEHIAFLCQVLSRYNQLINTSSSASSDQTNTNTDSSTSEIQLLLSELSGQYATLENYYITQSFQKAIISYNHPIEINNQRVFVPSIIEDTFYLCKRSIHRSFDTLSIQAMITICHVCVHMWNCSNIVDDDIINNVDVDEYSLIYAILSCHFNDDLIISEIDKEEETNSIIPSAPNSHKSDGNSTLLGTSSFAAALLGALDNEDSIGILSMNEPQQSAPTITAPTSSNRAKKSMNSTTNDDNLSSQISILNGLANASSACIAMSDLLLEKSTTNTTMPNNKIFQFNIDELYSYSREYKNKLKNHCYNMIQKYCYHKYPQIKKAKTCFLSQLYIYFNNQLLSYGDLTQDAFILQEHLFYDDFIIHSIRNNILIQIICNNNNHDDDNDDDVNHSLSSFDTTVSFQLLDTIVDIIIDIILSNVIFYNSANTTTSTSSTEDESNSKDNLNAEDDENDNHNNREISFNDWGVILLSKQIRYLNDLFTDIIFSIQESIVSTTTNHTIDPTAKSNQQQQSTSSSTDITGKSILSKFEKLNIIITILQLEKPNDWISLGYYKEIVIVDDDNNGGESNDMKGNNDNYNNNVSFTKQEIYNIMKLKKDFLDDAIKKACFY